MTNNKKLQDNLKNKSNREIFYICSNYIKNNKLDISNKEIEYILMHVNNYASYTDLVCNYEKKCANLHSFKKIFNKIINGLPLFYALGYAYFLDYKLNVNKYTLIPRSETEELCLKIKQYIKSLNIKHDSFADICGGSGCISVFIANEFKNSKVYCVEKYKRTFDVLKTNAIYKNIVVFLGDKIKPLIKNNIKVDVLISNPPYVENKNDIELKVLKNEPIQAIYNKSGYEFYEYYFKNFNKITNDKFFMAFEINYNQEEILTSLIKKYFKNTKISYKFEKDIYNKIRFLFILGGYDENL